MYVENVNLTDGMEPSITFIRSDFPLVFKVHVTEAKCFEKMKKDDMIGIISFFGKTRGINIIPKIDKISTNKESVTTVILGFDLYFSNDTSPFPINSPAFKLSVDRKGKSFTVVYTLTFKYSFLQLKSGIGLEQRALDIEEYPDYIFGKYQTLRFYQPIESSGCDFTLYYVSIL